MKKKNRIIAIVALVLIAAMVVTSVVSAFIICSQTKYGGNIVKEKI